MIARSIFAACTAALFSIPMMSSPVLAATSSLKLPDGGQISIQAESASRDLDQGTLELSGNVQVVFNQQYIRADRAVINQKREEITAIGNVVISSQMAYVEGDSAVLNYRTNTGIIQNGFVKSGQVVFEGRVVRKTGPQSYEADGAYYTACTTCPPAWSFSGTRINAEMGGYAYIKNSVFSIADIPILWLPYLIVPLKSERQTGLLVPTFDLTDGSGLAVGMRFFWAISRSQDALFTLKNYPNRGLKGLANYRYVLSETSYGELNTGIIRDRRFPTYSVFSNQSVGSKDLRYFVDYDHFYDLPFGFTQRSQIKFVSDLHYTRDFLDEIPGYGDPALENRLSMTRNTEQTHASLDAIYYLNQLRSNPIASNSDAVHRWPALRFAAMERPLFNTGLLFNFDGDYVNFAREEFAFDDVVVSGGVRTINPNRPSGRTFNPSEDLIRAGQRLDLRPEISYPIHFGRYLDVLPLLQIRHTQYSFNVAAPTDPAFDSTPFRQYVRASVSARTRFYRIYGNDDSDLTDEKEAETKISPPAAGNWADFENRGVQTEQLNPPSVPETTRANRYRHEVEPEVVFSGVPPIQQSSSTFFGEETSQIPVFLDNQPVSNSDFYSTRGIQFDYEDRLVNRNTVSFILNNRLVRKSWYAGTPVYKQIANLRIGQSYDFDEDKKTGRPKFPYSDISALLDVRLERFETNTSIRYFPYHNVANTSSRVRLMDDGGRFFQINFTQTYLITQRVEEAYPGRTEDIGFSAGFKTKYIDFAGGVNYQPVRYWPLTFEQKSWIAEMNIKPPGNCWSIKYGIEQRLKADLIQRFNLEYNFGGES